MVEYIDIINEKNVVIGRATKEEIREKLHLYRSCHIWVVNSKGEILVQKRSKTIIPYPGMYDTSVGGYVSSGEDYRNAAIREVEEELGVEVCELEDIGWYISKTERNYVRRVVFVCHHDGPFTLQEEEVESVRFLPISQVKKEMKERPQKWTKGSVKSLEVLEEWVKKIKCNLCGTTIPQYDPAFHHLTIDINHSANFCQRCIDAFVKWQQNVYTRLFPTTALKKRFGGRK